MVQKTEKKRPIHKQFLFNLALIIAICIVIYWIVFSMLGWYTRHGESFPTPQLVGLNLKEAKAAIKPFHFNLEIDSIFNPKKKPLTILSQHPDSGFLIKKGHTLFLTVNKTKAPTIPMPNLVNLSYRSAIMVLKTNKLFLKDTIMRPDLAQGAILEQLFHGKPIKEGFKIPQGSAITLVVGDGLGRTEMQVPDIIGLSYPEATVLLSGSNLNYSVVFDGKITDTMTAVVYMQNPTAINEMTLETNTIEVGMVITFRVKQ